MNNMFLFLIALFIDHPTSINYLSIFVKNIKESIFFDFTSMELNKDSYFVIECFNLLFEHEEF